jgi:hypothetical protein
VTRLIAWLLSLVALGSVLLVAGCGGSKAHASRAGAGQQASVLRAEVAIASAARMTPVPQSFLGISTEYWALPVFERHLPVLERLLSLLQVRGDGPLILRIGGDSADCTFWQPRPQTLPPWGLALTSAWWRVMSVLLRRVNARVILDLNLVTGTPVMAARLAAAAEHDLPPGSIVGFEIGNEPDLYGRSYWLTRVLHGVLGECVLPLKISAASYARDFTAYASVLARVAPAAVLLGPAASNPESNLGWIATLLDVARRRVGILSAHEYPYSACANRNASNYPTIPRVLSEDASAGMARTVRAAVLIAHRAGLRFRLTELNSVTCGGLPGVSDTFATGLWAPDALFELLRAGVDGVNVHVRPDLINAAFTVTRTGLAARPLFYGLVLFARTLGPGAQLVPVEERAKRSSHLKVWAVRISGGMLHVLLIDKSARPVQVDLRLPTAGPATVQRLLASSVRSSSNVTLDGQQLTGDGRWEGKPSGQIITPGIHGYQLTIPPMSAALIAAHLRPGALAPGCCGRRSGSQPRGPSEPA